MMLQVRRFVEKSPYLMYTILCVRQILKPTLKSSERVFKFTLHTKANLDLPVSLKKCLVETQD